MADMFTDEEISKVVAKITNHVDNKYVCKMCSEALPDYVLPLPIVMLHFCSHVKQERQFECSILERDEDFPMRVENALSPDG